MIECSQMYCISNIEGSAKDCSGTGVHSLALSLQYILQSTQCATQTCVFLLALDNMAAKNARNSRTISSCLRFTRLSVFSNAPWLLRASWTSTTAATKLNVVRRHLFSWRLRLMLSNFQQPHIYKQVVYNLLCEQRTVNVFSSIHFTDINQEFVCIHTTYHTCVYEYIFNIP